MIVFVICCAVITLLYLVLMLLYRHGWNKQECFTVPEHYLPSTSISIIIPARNEEGNIGKCIDSILTQQFPAELMEIIVVDDHSVDGTASIVQSYKNIKYISLADYLSENGSINAYKKKALSIGIQQSKGTLIVTTDADCISTMEWLRYIAARYEQDKPVMIVGPVDFTANNTIVERFQSIDFMSMQGITVAAHSVGMGSMSNGANLAFTRDAYNAVGGYEGIDHFASGDDYLLMIKLQKVYPERISYLKATKAIVTTKPQPNWGAFLQQRIRWASKSGKYNDTRLTAILIIVYLFNFSFLVTTIAAFFIQYIVIVPFSMLILKMAFELYYLLPVAVFFKKGRQLIAFPFLQPLHILYIILAGFMGFVGVYKWKGRVVR
ncbi:MAG: glycosyltransferase [Bacteroidota bacterium]